MGGDANPRSDFERQALRLMHDEQDRNKTNPRVSVVIPTRDEARNLPAVFARLPEELFEVILVDGNSSDDTVQVARELRHEVRVLQQTGKGKGNALAEGLAAADGDILVTLDADGSTDPAEIPRFVSALVAGADLVKGSRFAQGGGSADITPMRRFGNRILCGLVNGIYGTSYSDLCYGYNGFWSDCLPVLQSRRPLHSVVVNEDSPFGTGFEVETVINVRAAKAGLRVWEVPSYECRRIYGESSLNALRDGLRVLSKIWTESPAFSARYTGAMAAPQESVRGLLPLPQPEVLPATTLAVAGPPETPLPPASASTNGLPRSTRNNGHPGAGW